MKKKILAVLMAMMGLTSYAQINDEDIMFGDAEEVKVKEVKKEAKLSSNNANSILVNYLVAGESIYEIDDSHSEYLFKGVGGFSFTFASSGYGMNFKLKYTMMNYELESFDGFGSESPAEGASFTQHMITLAHGHKFNISDRVKLDFNYLSVSYAFPSKLDEIITGHKSGFAYTPDATFQFFVSKHVAINAGVNVFYGLSSGGEGDEESTAYFKGLEVFGGITYAF